MKIAKILKFLDNLAPFDTAESYDNVGLIIGSKQDSISGIVVCLDCTLDVVNFAIEHNANTIISHHPLIFNELKQIFTDEPKGAIIKKIIMHNINLIAMHTNIDVADKGTAYATAKLLGLEDIYSSLFEPYLKLAQLEDSMSAEEFNSMISEKMHCNSRLYGDPQKPIKLVAIAPGAASEAYITAIKHQADAFVCGEAKHHHILDACARGLVFIENGHHANEFPVVNLLASTISREFEDVAVFEYKKDPFIFA